MSLALLLCNYINNNQYDKNKQYCNYYQYDENSPVCPILNIYKFLQNVQHLKMEQFA